MVPSRSVRRRTKTQAGCVKGRLCPGNDRGMEGASVECPLDPGDPQMNHRRWYSPFLPLLLAATVPALCAFATGCQKSQAAEAPAGPPGGEAWLTAQQI